MYPGTYPTGTPALGIADFRPTHSPITYPLAWAPSLEGAKNNFETRLRGSTCKARAKHKQSGPGQPSSTVPLLPGLSPSDPESIQSSDFYCVHSPRRLITQQKSSWG